MRICYFCSVTSFDTGMPINTFRLIEHFSCQSSYHVFTVFPEEGELVRRLRDLGVNVAIIPFSRLRSPRRNWYGFIKSIITLPKAYYSFICFCKKNNIDIIHFSDFLDAPFYFCAKIAGVTAIAHLRWCLEALLPRLIFKGVATLFLARVICISKAVKRYSGLSESRTAVIYNPGPDAVIFNRTLYKAQDAAAANRPVTIIAISKFVAVKGLDNFITMAALVEAKMPGLCRYRIIGDKYPGHESFYNRMLALIIRLNLENKVSILGQLSRTEVARQLAAGDIFAHLVRYEEALGGAILEAMAMQLPIVAFNCGGIGECFTHAESGFLVPAGNVPAAAELVLRLISDAALRRTMGARASLEVQARFPADRFYTQIAKLYQQHGSRP